MDTQDFFPDFQPNQVLTSTQLNQLRKYLDGQTRLSRVRLTGTGIICGLFGKTDNGESIEITGGYGITSDGYIIEIENAVYPKYRNYHDPDTVDPENDEDDPYPVYEPWRTEAKPYQQIGILELMSEAQLNDPEFVEIEDNPTQELSADVLEDKVLVLYLEMEHDPLKSCIVTDCNNKGENVVLTVRALLISKEDLEAVELCGEKDKLIYFPRLITYLQSKGKNLSQLENSYELNKAYQKIAELAAGEIIDKVTNAFDKYKNILNLEPEYEETVANLPAILDEITSPNFDQYRFDFIRNLARAYNEFSDVVCPLVKQCMFSGVFPRHLMLRDFIIDGSGIGDSGKYRHYFMPSPARNVLHNDLEEAQKYFARIILLAMNPDFGTAQMLKITPGQTAMHKLGENAIPHYYKLGPVEKWWQPADCCSLHPPLSYDKNSMDVNPTPIMPLNPKANPLHLDPGQFGFYNIEGAMGKKLSEVLQNLQQLKLQFNLEFDVVGLSFDEFVQGGFSQGLEQLKEMLAEIESLRKALETAILEGVQQNQEEIVNLIGQIAEKEAALLDFNQEWISQRKAISANCNISHLQADYLQLRSELICTYHGILQALGGIPEIPPPQGDGCVDFDELETGKTFDGDNIEPGSVIFNQNNIPVSMHEFFWVTGGTGYNWAQVMAANAEFGEGNIMWTNNVNLGFDFTQMETAPNKVTFLYRNQGGNENIMVNNGERIISLIKNGEGEIAPGVNLEVQVISADANINMAILTGPVQTLQVGGQEFSIDQVCATVEESSIPSYPIKLVNLRKKSLDGSIGKLEKKLKSTGSSEEKKTYKVRLEKLKKDRSDLENISRISKSVNGLIRDVMVKSNAAGLENKIKADGFTRGFSPLAGSQNPMQDLVYGFYLAIIDLQSKIEMLLNILPKDVRGFNYMLYVYTVKEILEQIVRIRLFINYLLEIVVAGSGTLAPLMRFLAGPLLSSITRNLPKIMDFLNAYQKLYYNCFPAELATIYFHLEHLLNLNLGSFGNFAKRHTGMEHMAGVPKGGTFIVVGEKSEESQLVKADFALHGKSECCCDIDPDDICLPPIGRIDSRTVEAEINPQTGELLDVEIFIDVLKNDLKLNDPNAELLLELPANTSRMGAELTVSDVDGKKVIRYHLAQPHPGVDEFAYTITETSDRCQLSDTGKVILLVREKSNTPFYAGGDIAVTHVNTPVIVDVALNDVANPQLLQSGYALTAPSPTAQGNIVEVITIENRRPALNFIPVEGFTGRDQFTYTITIGTTKALGVVTALVIPCCNGQGNAPAMITGTVYERTPEGLEGALSGGRASLIQNGNVISTANINKAKYTFRNVSPGTYDVMLGKWDPDTGEPTHETKTINGVTATEGRTVTLDLVILNRLPGNTMTFVQPEIVTELGSLTKSLESNSGVSKSKAEKILADTLTPRMSSRTNAVNEVKNSGLVQDKKLLDETGNLVSGKSFAKRENTKKAYKDTLKKLISKHASAEGEAKTAYRKLIDSTVTAMLDEVATTEVSKLKAGTKKQLKEVAGQLKDAGISLNSIRNKWKSSELKNKLKTPVVTDMNKILS